MIGGAYLMQPISMTANMHISYFHARLWFNSCFGLWMFVSHKHKNEMAQIWRYILKNLRGKKDAQTALHVLKQMFTTVLLGYQH